MKGKRMLALLLALALLGGLTGCFLFGKEEQQEEEEEDLLDLVEWENEEFPVQVGEFSVRSRPDSVVSLSPSLTEKLGDLGLESKLVGVSDYCDYPVQVLDLPKCGTAQLPNLDQIESLAPHLVLAEAELTDEAIAALRELQIDVVVIPRPESIETWKESYRTLLRVLQGEFTGSSWADSYLGGVQDSLDSLARFAAHTQESGEERKSVLYLRMLPFVVATGDTLEQELLELIGLENLAKGYTGWHMDLEQAEEERDAFEALDIIYCDEYAENGVTIEDLEQSEFYKNLQAVVQDRYLYIDTRLFERQGQRMFAQLEQMGAYAYPDAALARLVYNMEESGADSAGEEEPQDGREDTEAGGQEEAPTGEDDLPD